MSRKSKPNRRFGERASRKARDGAAQEGAAGRAKGSRDLRDKIAVLVAAAIVIALLVFGFVSFYRSDRSDQQSAVPPLAGSTAGPRAAIVDHLSLTHPNPTFIETATALLEQAGYAVDYYAGEEVTVEFYRHLPEYSHELLILRVHSARLLDKAGALTDPVALFTSEAYSQTRYLEEQRADRVRPVLYGYMREDLPRYFGITPTFIESSMKGKFDDTTIILMGCDGLRSQETADAFLERGAGAFVSWTRRVSAAHTDAATERLLQHLLSDGVTIQEAVTRTMAEVGPDPAYGSTLLVHPSEEPVAAVP